MRPYRSFPRPNGSAIAPRRGTRRWFVPSVILSILTALLCALLPAGLPSTTSVGSAFSPATTAVSLNAPASARLATKRLVRDGDSDTGERPAVHAAKALAIATATVAAPPRAAPSVAMRLGSDALPPHAPRGAAYPRGPPPA